jgi:hypothetical protein
MLQVLFFFVMPSVGHVLFVKHHDAIWFGLPICAGKQWREKQIRLIADKAYNRIKKHSGSANLTFEDLYIAVLLVYKYKTVFYYLVYSFYIFFIAFEIDSLIKIISGASLTNDEVHFLMQ